MHHEIFGTHRKVYSVSSQTPTCPPSSSSHRNVVKSPRVSLPGHILPTSPSISADHSYKFLPALCCRLEKFYMKMARRCMSSSATCFLGPTLYFCNSPMWTHIALILPLFTAEYPLLQYTTSGVYYSIQSFNWWIYYDYISRLFGWPAKLLPICHL